MKNPLDQRLLALIRALDEMTEDYPSLEGMDVNEILGTYDGKLMVIRETWQELRTLLFGDSNALSN